ncbi:MAG: hypothetical protein B7Y40_02500 [Gammaproteobacteria bacterium 28-57-27]|nr:MAG: hypothetical protein B7Y40_02500 [Gammaproteobacteria bacterium 28-57-27]
MTQIYLTRFSASALLMLALTCPALASQSPAPFDPMQSLLSEAASVSTAVAQQPSEEIEKRKKSDPKFKAAYEHYINGGWEYFDDHAEAAPGEDCAAFFWKGDGMVRLSGPGGDYKGALMTFWGASIPTPDKSQKVKVTLKQSGEAPQSVHAFNYKLPGDTFGSIVFAVPTIEALLDGMEDVASFNLEIDGTSVAKVEWHGGMAARDRLRKCVNAKK